jgi:hypothetical protein
MKINALNSTRINNCYHYFNSKHDSQTSNYKEASDSLQMLITKMILTLSVTCVKTNLALFYINTHVSAG